MWKHGRLSIIIQGMTLGELDKILRSRLSIASFNDISLNGVQVACSTDRQISKVAVAVDACQASIDAAVEEGADMLFVHHGLFWGSPIAIDGIHSRPSLTLMSRCMPATFRWMQIPCLATMRRSR